MEFIKANLNPKGVITCDCSIRAIAQATGMRYEDIRTMEFNNSVLTGYMMDDMKNITSLLAKMGFERHGKPFKDDGTTYKAGEMDELVSKGYTAIVQIAHHLTCVYQSKIIDLWDCRSKSVYGYWTRKI